MSRQRYEKVYVVIKEPTYRRIEFIGDTRDDCRGRSSSELCGGCTQCLITQAGYYGLDLIFLLVEG